MASNDWKDRLGMVYSTAADYQFTTADDSVETLEASKQDLRVWLDKKHRAGKVATIVRGFVGSDDDLKDLAKVLKSKCGVGGSAKDGEIIIQGDHRDRVVEILTKSGYKSKKAGG
ncbi:MAG: translation initiation factor [Rikenellaceae bacterium]